ncbi:DivIVA domain-containing protein [Amycolatopsis sp. 195334CR]|uniref:DivIVA domain-containing protein n=1 Tax=Amycolatopsis sp. 195334CR TaxID=2814588 RepID=UPI001A8C3288|nr:DivIVA domain-containing protein [Amycolatopsis sp. 195334CR]MBN6034665.1 DivIVA domain-containing protein [Amycolatopsis sp. 195334CR]
MSLSADDARSTAFGNAPIGRRGYAKNEVDDFVQRIAATLDGQDDLTAAEVHHVVFGKPLIGKRGYDEREVDEFLDTAEEALLSHFGADWRAHQVPAAREAAQATDAPFARSAPADQYLER